MPDRRELLCTIGFACCQGFVFSLFYVGENRAVHLGSLLFERADLFVTLAFMVVTFALLWRASARALSAAFSRSLLWCYAVLLVLGSLLPVMVEPGVASVVSGGTLVGVPYALTLAAWGRALVSGGFSHAIRNVFIAAIIAALVCLVCAAIPVAGVVLILKALPLGSAAALTVLLPSSSLGGHVGAPADAADADGVSGGNSVSAFTFHDLIATHEQRHEAHRLSRNIIAGTVLFGAAAGLMETFASDPGMASNPTYPASLLLLALFSLAALQLLGSPAASSATGDAGRAALEAPDSPGSLDATYRLSVLVMMAGFLFVPVLGQFGVPGESVVLAGYLGLTYVLVSLFMVMAQLMGLDVARSFARGFAALYAGELCGIALGNGIELFTASDGTPFAVAAFAGLATLFAYQFLFSERDFRSLSVMVQEVDRFDEMCALVTQENGLSKREAEILRYALRGRTSDRIAQELFISKSTVDTHLRRIYQKTGVHGRQELIDLGERTVRGLSTNAEPIKEII